MEEREVGKLSQKCCLVTRGLKCWSPGLCFTQWMKKPLEALRGKARQGRQEQEKWEGGAVLPVCVPALQTIDSTPWSQRTSDQAWPVEALLPALATVIAQSLTHDLA